MNDYNKPSARSARLRRRRHSRLYRTLRLLALLFVIGIVAELMTSVLPEGGTTTPQPKVVIGQVMTSNPEACFPVEEQFYDWLELVNTGTAPVDLTGWKLSKELDIRKGYVFDGITLAPGEAKIVYCADAPENYSGPELFTGFKLGSDGESLLLADVGEKHVQALYVPAMPSGSIYTRSASGGYTAVPFEQSGYGAEEEENLTPDYDPQGVTLNEIMVKDASTLLDGDGERSDWIELYNGGAAPVNLAGWALSDDDDEHMKWLFPDVTLGAGEYLIVFASGKDRTDPADLHTNFRLSSKGEILRLYNAKAVAVSWAEVGESEADRTTARQPDGTLRTDCDPSPGYPNTDEGVRLAKRAAYDGLVTNAEGLYINELFTTGKGDDWLELVNTGDTAVDLSGMGLSDNPAHTRKWQFPRGVLLESGEYLVVYLTGAEGKTGLAEGGFSANLGISGDEIVTLARADGSVIDRVWVEHPYKNISFGRAEGYDTYRYFGTPTPGAANEGKSYGACASEVEFSLPGGAYDGQSIQLELSNVEGMDIYYTLDGSAPSPKSTVYTQPIEITGPTVVKAVAWQPDAKQSPMVMHVFSVGASHSLRVMYIIGNEASLSGANGVLNTGQKDEQAVFVQLYDYDGSLLISQNCGLKLAGHHSRTNFAQKGFTLRARKAYGKGKFDGKLFRNLEYEEYDSLFMRASGQDVEQTHMRDSILTALAANTNVLYQETELCAVYVNGRYWGEYNMRERVDTDFIAQHENWENPDDVVLLEGSGSQMMTVQGSASGFRDLLALAKKLDFKQDSSVDRLREMMDVENYLDYVAMQMYTANQDLNNVRVYCIPAAGVKWKWILFDLDLSFQVDSDSARRWLKSGGVGTITSQDNTLFIGLMKNARMKDYFLTRMGSLMASTLSSGYVVTQIELRRSALQDEMAMTCARWGWSQSTWESYVNNMVSYARSRPNKLMGYIKDAFGLSSEQMQRYFGAAMQNAG